MRKYFYYIVVLGILAFTPSLAVRAQDDEDVQSWNDLQITVPFNKYLDGFTQVTMRFGKNITRLNDGRYAFGLNIKPNKAWTITPFYWYVHMRNAAGVFRSENRFVLRIGYKFPVKKFELSHRSQFEWRYRASGNTWRYRPSLTFAKEIPKKYISNAKFYITDEVFYDSATDKFSRNRFTAGISKTLNAHWAVDLYYMRQNDGFAHPGDLNVIGTSWKLKF
jgi:hypothetical protein